MQRASIYSVGLPTMVYIGRDLMRQARQLTSVVNLLQAIRQSEISTRRPDGLPACLFRGQPTDKPLLPRFAREALKSRLQNVLHVERRMLDDFSRLALPYLTSARPRNRFEWLAV